MSLLIYFFFLTRSERVTSDRTNEEMGEESESLACRRTYVRAEPTLPKGNQAPVPLLGNPDATKHSRAGRMTYGGLLCIPNSASWRNAKLSTHLYRSTATLNTPALNLASSNTSNPSTHLWSALTWKSTGASWHHLQQSDNLGRMTNNSYKKIRK